MGLHIKGLKTIEYERHKVAKGYTNQFLSVDLSKLDMSTHPIPPEIKNGFIGGKGFDLCLPLNR